MGGWTHRGEEKRGELERKLQLDTKLARGRKEWSERKQGKVKSKTKWQYNSV